MSFAEKEVDDIKEHLKMLNKQVPVHLFIYLLLTQRYQPQMKVSMIWFEQLCNAVVIIVYGNDYVFSIAEKCVFWWGTNKVKEAYVSNYRDSE